MIRFGPNGSELVYGSTRGHIDIKIDESTWSDVLALGEKPGLGYHKEMLHEFHYYPEKQLVHVYARTGDYGFSTKTVFDNLFQLTAKLPDILNAIGSQ